MVERKPAAVWFPTVRTGTGTDVSTKRLAAGLRERGLRAEITWLPLRAEYAPWTVPVPKPPAWANLAYVNTWLHSRFLPKDLPIVAGLRHSVHDPVARPYKGAARAAYHRRWIAPNERRVMRRAARVIAVSHFAADTGRKTLVDVPIDVIYNGIDTTLFRPGTRQRQPGKPFRLLYVGSWMARKGVDLLAPIMRELGAGFELHYTGGPAATQDKHLMPANMRDIGRLGGEDAVLGAMQNADALLFPSRSEGFGLVAAEAMACGLPVIATRGSSLTEVIEDGVTGTLCPDGDVPAFAAACRSLARDPQTHDRQSRAGRQRVIDRFGYAGMIDGYIAIYEKLLAGACRQ